MECALYKTVRLPGLSIERFQRGICTFWKMYSVYKNVQIVQKLCDVREKHTSRTQVLQVVHVWLKLCAYMSYVAHVRAKIKTFTNNYTFHGNVQQLFLFCKNTKYLYVHKYMYNLYAKCTKGTKGTYKQYKRYTLYTTHKLN